MGGDGFDASDVDLMIFISTHAPAWGATAPMLRQLPLEKHFYSRPRVGGDLFETVEIKRADYFYSRPRVGGDLDGILS